MKYLFSAAMLAGKAIFVMAIVWFGLQLWYVAGLIF